MACHKHFEEFGEIHIKAAEGLEPIFSGPIVPQKFNLCRFCGSRTGHFIGRKLCPFHAKSEALHNALREAEKNCEECQEYDRKENERIQRDCTIDPSQPYGQHIVLTCKNHPELRWNTKNIECIGARSIFFRTHSAEECNCPIRDLIVLQNEEV
jgi:hypothetical protein